MTSSAFLDAYPWLLPGLAATIAASMVLGPRVGRMVAVRALHGSVLVLAVGLALSATLTPGTGAFTDAFTGPSTCDLSRTGLATVNQIARRGEVALNLALLIPLGVAVGLLPRSNRKAAAVLAAMILPIAIEGIQFLAVPLGRACQGGDVIDNLTGLTVGIGGATAATWVWSAWTEARVRTAALRAAVVVVAGSGLLALAIVSAPQPVPLTPIPAPSAATTPPPPPSETITVTSVPALLDALADDSLSEIVVADGTYSVSPAADQAEDSLWIGSRFAERTRPVTVRAQTVGGVAFDGGGATHFGGLTFVEGAHHQTWQGFVFAEGVPTSTGVIVFGGYAGFAAPHDITLRDIAIPSSITSTSPGATDHAVYFSRAVGGPHDILIDGLTVDGDGGLDSAIHFFGSDEANINAWNVTIRRLQVRGTEQAIIVWDETVHDIRIETARIRDALDFAVRYEAPGERIVLTDVISTGSGSGQGFHSSLGPAPPGITVMDSSLR